MINLTFRVQVIGTPKKVILKDKCVVIKGNIQPINFKVFD